MVLVNKELRHNTMPLSVEGQAQLLEILHEMAVSYSEKESAGLPPKLFYFLFEQAQLLVVYSKRSMVAVLLHPEADITPLEEAARKIVATAHLGQTMNEQNPAMNLLFPKLETKAAGLTQLQKQQSALEKIMAKVVTQSLAHKWVIAELEKFNVNAAETETRQNYEAVVSGLTGKIPNRMTRQLIEKEMRVALACC